MTSPAPPAPRTPPAEHRSARPGNRLRRALLHLVGQLHRWAESGWVLSAIAGWAVMQGSVMPGPSDILLIPLGLADPRRAFSFAAAATAGAVVGGLIAFAIGAYAFEEVGRPLLSFLGVSDATLERSRVLFERRGWMIVILSTVSPLPTKLVSIAAGAFGVPLPHFLFGITVGRAARFFAIAFLLRFAGERLTARIERSLGRSVARLN